MDNVLVHSEYGEKVLREDISKYFKLKEAPIVVPDIYFGYYVLKVILDNDDIVYAFGSNQYVQVAVSNVDKYLNGHTSKLPFRAMTQLSSIYQPEADV